MNEMGGYFVGTLRNHLWDQGKEGEGGRGRREGRGKGVEGKW